MRKSLARGAVAAGTLAAALVAAPPAAAAPSGPVPSGTRVASASLSATGTRMTSTFPALPATVPDAAERAPRTCPKGRFCTWPQTGRRGDRSTFPGYRGCWTFLTGPQLSSSNKRGMTVRLYSAKKCRGKSTALRSGSYIDKLPFRAYSYRF
ncbi:peptidase inhibitor family I36 protein [Spirillospora sp. NPDC127200]